MTPDIVFTHFISNPWNLKTPCGERFAPKSLDPRIYLTSTGNAGKRSYIKRSHSLSPAILIHDRAALSVSNSRRLLSSSALDTTKETPLSGEESLQCNASCHFDSETSQIMAPQASNLRTMTMPESGVDVVHWWRHKHLRTLNLTLIIPLLCLFTQG